MMILQSVHEGVYLHQNQTIKGGKARVKTTSTELNRDRIGHKRTVAELLTRWLRLRGLRDIN